MNSAPSLTSRGPLPVGSHLETDAPTQGSPLPPARVLLQSLHVSPVDRKRPALPSSGGAALRGCLQKAGSGVSCTWRRGLGSPFRADPASTWRACPWSSRCFGHPACKRPPIRTGLWCELGRVPMEAPALDTWVLKTAPLHLMQPVMGPQEALLAWSAGRQAGGMGGGMKEGVKQ